MPAIVINGKQIESPEGQTLLDAASSEGITIPTLCHHPDLSPVGTCRLCLVEVEGWDRQTPACCQPVMENMVVQTETPALVSSRKFVLELLLRSYVDDSTSGDATEFMRWVKHYDVHLRDGVNPPPRFPVDADPNPFVRVDFNKCILCTRCVRACEEIQGRFVWGVGYRGHDSRIIAGAELVQLTVRRAR